MNKNIELLSNQLTVIVVTFNSAHCILELSNSLAHIKNIIFVDNASDDGTINLIRSNLPHAIILENKKNIGFGAANNLALNLVKTPYSFLLNPDCIPEKKFFVEILNAASSFTDAAMIAPQIIDGQKNLEINYRWSMKNWRSKGNGASGPCCVGFVCGAAILLNMNIMKTIGFFDEQYFLYYEDEDLCQRTFEKNNQIIVIPTISIIHLSRASVKGSNPLKSEFIRGYHHAQSKIIFEAKHIGSDQANKLKFKTLFLAILTLPIRLLLPQPRYIARLIGRIIGLCKLYQRPTLPIK
jgi:N-acetylglucosaminyl-diphospho-decaprenol L-rhamnosyltransferase